MKPRRTLSLPALVLALTLTATPALAAPAPAAPAAAAVTPVFGGYWQGFLEHWGGMLQKQNGIVLTALAVGAVSLLIITRGKWKK